jgi:phage I-like protein
MIKSKHREKGNEVPEFSIKRLITRIDNTQFSEGVKNNPVSEIEVLTEGTWEHAHYGTIEITEQDIERFVHNFNNRVRKIDIAVDQEHMPEKGAVGWFKELQKVVEGGISKLKASVEWTSLGVQLLGEGIYKYFSPEFDFNYEDPETHDVFQNVLLGGALTNRPYFKSLAPVMLSENVFIKLNEEGGVTMENEELQANPVEEEAAEAPEEVEAEEVEVEAEEELNAESEEAEEVEFEDTAEDVEEGEEEVEEPEEEEEGAIEASEIPSAKEFNDIKSELGVLRKKMKFAEVEEKVRGYTFSESNQKGKLLPKSKEVAHRLLMSLDDRRAKLFEEVVNSLPTPNSMMFDEMGGDGESVKASEELGSKVMAIIKENEGMTYGQALKKVSADNPELVKKAELGN